MKQIITQNWLSAKNTHSLKFFVQVVEDMLFDFNLSSYKVKMLNTHYLCKEFLMFYELIKNKTISENAHKSIIYELVFSLRNDDAAKEIFNELYESYVSEINNNQDKIDNLYKIIKLIDEILDDAYYDKMKDLLIDLILNDKDEKKKIRRITQSLLSELINMGYSKRYIYNNINYLFLNKSSMVYSTDKINEFFGIFDLEPRKYTSLFKLKKNDSIYEALKKTNFKISDSLPGNYSSESRFSQKGYLYIDTPELDAFDPFSAKELAEDFILTFEAFMKYNYHRQHIKIEKKALILDKKSKKVLLIEEAIMGINKQPDNDKNKISENTERIFRIVSNLESSDSLVLALKSHSDAIKADNINHQFITLWSAMESLINTTGKDTNIEAVNKVLEPIFTLDYFFRYTHNMYLYLIKKYPADYSTLLDKMECGETDFQKTVLFLAMKEKSEPLRDEFYAIIKEDNPLLVNKIYHLVGLLNNTDELLKGLKKHNNNIKWQIRRIYRTRNVIIHGNDTLPYINTLIENLHEYFDRTIEIILKTSELNPSITDLEGVFYQIKFLSEHYIKSLEEHKNTKIDETNFEKLILNKF